MGVHACLRAGVKMGDKVLVCGAGRSSGNHIYGAATLVTMYICGKGNDNEMGIGIAMAYRPETKPVESLVESLLYVIIAHVTRYTKCLIRVLSTFFGCLFIVVVYFISQWRLEAVCGYIHAISINGSPVNRKWINSSFSNYCSPLPPE